MTYDLSKMTRRSKKSADVTLVYNEDMIPKGQEVILNVDYNLLKNVHDDELPAGWKLTKQLEQSYNWVEGEGKEKTLPHYLNAGNTVAKMKEEALLGPFESVLKFHGVNFTGSIKFSTGMYYAVLVPLLWDWLGMVGEAATCEDSQGLLLKVEAVTAQQDKAGAAQSYKVNLQVENQIVVIHFFNTRHKILVQGKQMANNFCEKVLTPFFHRKSSQNEKKISMINNQMMNPGRGEKRPRDPTKTKATPNPKKMSCPQIYPDRQSEVIPQNDQQLSESILVLSTIHPSSLLGTPSW